MGLKDQDTGQQLISRIREGEEAAFRQLYEAYYPIVYRFLHKFLKSAELTEDLVQDVFMKVWDNRADLPQLLSAKSYLLTIAKNHAFNFLKRAGIDQAAKSAILSHYNTEGNSLENAIHYRDYKRYLDSILETLTPQSRQVFRLCRQEGKTYEETAELLGISRNAVKKHMVRSMRILGDSVERDLGISLSILLAVLTHFKP